MPTVEVFASPNSKGSHALVPQEIRDTLLERAGNELDFTVLASQALQAICKEFKPTKKLGAAVYCSRPADSCELSMLATTVGSVPDNGDVKPSITIGAYCSVGKQMCVKQAGAVVESAITILTSRVDPASVAE